MNKDRRRRLGKATVPLAEALARLAEARAIINEIRDEESEAYDNLSDGARDGDQGGDMQACIDGMHAVVDGLDSIDPRPMLRALQEIVDNDVPDADAHAPAMTAEEAERRRAERLPEWARDRIARLEEDLRKAEERAASIFSERTDDPTEIAISDYGSPLHGRILPTKQVAFPEYGITVSVERNRGGRGISIMGERSIVILPSAGNSIFLRNDER